MFYESLITSEDIRQEVALLQILGKEKVSAAIVKRKLERQATTQLNYEEVIDPDRDADIPDLREPEATEQLVRWAMEVSQEVQNIISIFLQDPSEESLQRTLKLLAHQGLLQEALSNKPTQKTKPQKTSYTSMMKRALPATKEELIIMITSAGMMERPASTVRSFLRRFAKNLEQDGSLRYHWKE